MKTLAVKVQDIVLYHSLQVPIQRANEAVAVRTPVCGISGIQRSSRMNADTSAI